MPSIIVPFFDETAFLRTALNSIFAQGLSDLQVIVVNDNPEGFTDADLTALIGACPVELIHHPENLGLSAARNTGLAAATGDLIGFLDADDYYTLSGLADHVALAWDSGADITHSQTWFTRAGSSTPRILPRDATFFPERKVAGGLIDVPEAQFITSSWSSLYRRDFLRENNLLFDTEQVRFEDRLFVLNTVTRARSIAFTGQPTRVWRGRAGSISVGRSTLETHRLQIQLLEKCQSHIRSLLESGDLPLRYWKRELFNTVSRLIWDLDVIDAILISDDPIYANLAGRIPTLLGDDSFGQAIFDDPVLDRINRTGMRTRKGRISRAAFFDIHRMLRQGDFAGAHDTIAACAKAPASVRPRSFRRKQSQSARRLVLHLGLHKTGSTYIQQHLHHYRTDLLARGILVPETGFSYQGHAARPGATPGHQGLISALRRGDDTLWKTLATEIAASQAHTVVLSCENMLFPTIPERLDWIARLTSHLGIFRETTPVALARYPDSYVEHFYREWVCGGAQKGAQSIDAFLVDHAATLTDFPALFAPIEDHLGAHIRLADFDRLRGKELWPGFCALAGLPTDLPARDVPQYPTPDRDSIQILHLLNAMVPNAATRDAVLRAWFALHPAPCTDASLLSPSTRCALIDRWADSSAEFARARGYAPDLNGARTRLRTESWLAPDTLPADQVAALMDLVTLARTGQPGAAMAESPAPPGGSNALLTIRLRPWAARLLNRMRPST